MSASLEKPSVQPRDYWQATAELLGGRKLLKHPLSSQIEAHDLVLEGIPARALQHLIGQLGVLSDSLEKTIGMSTRTIQRRKADPSKALSPEQSARTLKFAQVLAQATRVFGSQDDAEFWMTQPALGLDGRRPIDLVATPDGAKIVSDHLERVLYGVYI